MKIKLITSRAKFVTVSVNTFIIFTFLSTRLFVWSPKLENEKPNKELLDISDVYSGSKTTNGSYNNDFKEHIKFTIINISKHLTDLDEFINNRIIKIENDFNVKWQLNKFKSNTKIKVEYYNIDGKKVTSKKISINRFKYLLK